MKIDSRSGKEAETHFSVLDVIGGTALIAAEPVTGRTHQIRLHLAATGMPVAGDPLYGRTDSTVSGRAAVDVASSLALRAVALAYFDPFQKRAVRIQAPVEQFCTQFGFESPPGLSSDWK